MEKIESVLVLINPVSGRRDGEGLIVEANAFKYGLAKRVGLKMFVEKTSSNGGTIEIARQAARMGIKVILSVGGDGTAHEIVNGLLMSGISIEKLPLIIVVPNGNGNDLARHFGYPKGQGLKWAFRVLTSEEPLRYARIAVIDIGDATCLKNDEVIQRYFISTLSLGEDAKINNNALDLRRKYPFLSLAGKGVYVFAAVPELLSFWKKLNYPRLRVEMDGGNPFEISVVIGVVGNGGEYGGIFRPAPCASMEDGWLDVCFILPMGKGEILPNLVRFCLGTHVSNDKVLKVEGILPRAQLLHISSEDDFLVQMDGEIFSGMKELEITVKPKAIRLLVPNPGS